MLSQMEFDSPSPEFLESPARPWDEPLIYRKDVAIKPSRCVGRFL